MPQLGVPVSEDCSLKNTLASPVEIREWNIWGAADDVSSTTALVLAADDGR